ncbi:hypothetical protein D3C81_1178140 [compost metagenome]
MRQDRKNTKAAAIIPPEIAEKGSATIVIAGQATITTIAANPAPEVTPMMEASANGFRTALWIKTPLIANAIPAVAATSVRGSRRFSKTEYA